MTVYKSYNIIIKGQVQDIGFRNLVENIARSLSLRGRVYNDVDGSVKIICQGAVSAVKSLIDEIYSKSSNVGASVDDLTQEEIHAKIFLPPMFFKAPTDELSDVSRKLDIGIQSLQNIESNTLPTRNIEKNTELLIDGNRSLVTGQKALITSQEKMINILERIAEK
ncbi:MAG: acylphosphatase [Candidatus Hydrothermarchaeales archaeon]